MDENGHQKVRTNDALGRLASVQDCTGVYPSATFFQQTSYSYNTADQLTTVIDATGKNLTTLTYDSVGRKTQAADPDLGTWAYDYNPIGTLATRTDAKNQTLNYTYDDLDRLSGKSGSGLTVSYGYDGGGAGLGGEVMWGNVLHWGLQNWSKENGLYCPWHAGLSATWARDIPFQPYPF